MSSKVQQMPYVPDLRRRPERPIYGEESHPEETWMQFEARQSHYEALRDAWLLSEIARMLGCR